MPKPPGRRDGDLRALLSAGLAQVDALRSPPHAAVAATVDAARAIGRAHQAGLVNALLRRALRDGFPAGNADAAWPAWLLQALRNDWPGHADAIVAASSREAPAWLRANRRVLPADALRAQLAAEGVEALASPACRDGLRVDVAPAVPFAAMPAFQAGAFSIQDGSAQLVADALAPPAGGRVLDACAAPGGKAAHLLERDPALRLLALDVDATRLERVRSTLARLGLEGPNVRLHAADAAERARWRDGNPFDAILLDAPCTATGTCRRHPDVLHRIGPRQIAEMAELQAKLLERAQRWLKPGGVLVYAVCSLEQEEGEEQAARVGLEPLPITASELPAGLQPTGRGWLRTDPGMLGEAGGLDGFFVARWKA